MAALTQLVRMKLEMARKFKRQRNYHAAENELKEALAVYPEHTVVLQDMAKLYLAQGRVTEAARLADELLQRHPGSAGPLELMGEVMLRQGRPSEALAFLLEADRQTPSPYVKNQIVRALVRNREYAEAIRRALSGLEASPDDVYLLGSLEVAYAQSGQPDKAVEICEKLLRLKPQDPRATRDLIKNRLAELKPKEALAELEGLLKVPSYQGNAEIQKLAGQYFYKQASYERALAAYRAALALAPADLQAQHQLGFCQYRLGDLQGALATLEPFFQEDPLDAFVRTVVVACYQQLDQIDEMVRSFERALAAHPGAVQLHGILKKARKKPGRG